MHVFVTGASGHIGSALVPELLAAGHTVTGLARTARAAETVRALGAEPLPGDLDDLDGLAAAARAADGVVHLAFKHEELYAGGMDAAARADLRAIDTLGGALAGSDKPFVGTCATLATVLAGFRGRLTESDTLTGGPRVDAENRVIALAARGVRSSVVRLAPTVHSHGRYGFGSALIETARQAGVSGYLGDGGNRWPSVDTRDAARLYRLALESAPAGTRLHAVAEEGVPMREIAAAIGRRLDLPAKPVDEPGHFGFLAAFAGLDNPTSSRRTRELLGWAPSRPGLLADLTAG